MKTEKSCGCIILKDNQVLLIGAKDDGGKLFWSFPKGHQENDETDIETAIRETKEETGLDVEISDIVPIKTGHFVHGGTVYKNILLFIAKPLNCELYLRKKRLNKLNGYI
ncbi:NUDIX domain-containing protein [Candidatus Saccharibacteria bacterium]|nr:NUDIX domain-containing protein [Candidatus Saccharibacteria bacterium]